MQKKRRFPRLPSSSYWPRGPAPFLNDVIQLAVWEAKISIDHNTQLCVCMILTYDIYYMLLIVLLCCVTIYEIVLLCYLFCFSIQLDETGQPQLLRSGNLDLKPKIGNWSRDGAFQKRHTVYVRSSTGQCLHFFQEIFDPASI